MANENYKYYLATRIYSAMLNHHLPELAVKASNEAKIVSSILKYIAIVTVAISTIVVCTLFIKVSLLPVESYSNRSLQGKLFSPTEKLPIVQDNEEVYIGVNIEFEPQISSSNSSNKKAADHAKVNSSQKTIPLRKILLKTKPLNSHVFQSVTTPQPQQKINSSKTSPPLLKIIKTNSKNNTNKVEVKLMNSVETPCKDKTSKTEVLNKSLQFPFDMFHSFSFMNNSNKSSQENIDQNKSDTIFPLKIHPLFNFETFQQNPLDLFKFHLIPEDNSKEIPDETSDQSSSSENIHYLHDDSNEFDHWPFINFKQINLNPLNSILFKPTNSKQTELFVHSNKPNHNFYNFSISSNPFFNSAEIGFPSEIEKSFSHLTDKNNKEFDRNFKTIFLNKERFPPILNNNDFNDQIFPNIFNIF